MSIRTKRSVSSEDAAPILVGVAVFVLALSFPTWIGWFLILPYTVFVVLAVIAVFIGALLKILHTPNALAISFIGTSLSYVLLNICRVFIEINTPWLGKVAVVALIGFTSAVALVKDASGKRSIPRLTILLFIVATFSLYLLTRIQGFFYY